MEKEIRVLMILEVMGRPKGYIVESLQKLVDRIKQEKDVRVFEIKIAEPKQIEDKAVYSTFGEIDIEVKDMITLFRLIFSYMPSHVEITKPEDIRLKNFDFNDVCNELVRVLHKYDEIAKIVSFEKQILENKLKQTIGEEVNVKGEKPKKKRKIKRKKTKS